MSADKTDHKTAALKLLGDLDPENGLAIAAASLVHSNLAIAEGQERVAEEIKTFRELMAGSAT